MCSHSGWPLCKRPDLTSIEVSQHTYLSHQGFSLLLIYDHVDFLQPVVNHAYSCTPSQRPGIKHIASTNIVLSIKFTYQERPPHILDHSEG